MMKRALVDYFAAWIGREGEEEAVTLRAVTP